MSEIKLINKDEDCCACGACMNICPKSAISMKANDFGYLYPEIDKLKCIECGLCVRTCAYQNKEKQGCNPNVVYALTSKNNDFVSKSASGGVFAQLASFFIENNGVVYGVAFDENDIKNGAKHISVNNLKDLYRLQGSKYVQSNIGMTMKAVKNDLDAGLKVLFSGSPCQVAGLKSFLKKDYDNLYTVDVICHGVPSQRFFSDFLTHSEKKIKGKITDFSFRDKSKGQGMIARVKYTDKNGIEKEICKKGQLFSYFYLFLFGVTYRENCYSCPYAKKERFSDMTIGDYWGFNNIFDKNNVPDGMTDEKGISCALINTEKGSELFNSCKDSFIFLESSYEDVSKMNGQLKYPSKKNPYRERFFKVYAQSGYEGVERLYFKVFKKDILKYSIANSMPRNLKNIIHKISK